MSGAATATIVTSSRSMNEATRMTPMRAPGEETRGEEAVCAEAVGRSARCGGEVCAEVVISLTLRPNPVTEWQHCHERWTRR